ANVYVDLIDRERQKMDSVSIQSKYGSLFDQTISDAAGRTLDLIDLLNRESPKPEPVQLEIEPETPAVEAERVPSPAAAQPVTKPGVVRGAFVDRMFQKLFANAFSVNKWLLIVAIALTALSI